MLKRDVLEKIVGNDLKAIREFERVLGAVQANISGPSVITLDYSSTGTLNTPLPALYSYVLSTGADGNVMSGITWGVVVTSGSFSGAGPTVGGRGTGVLQINSGLATPSVTLVMTAKVDGRGYPPFSVTVNRSTAFPDSIGGTNTDATGALLSFSSASFVPITRDLSITTPSGVTTATLTAPIISVTLTNDAPVGVITLEMKWQRETAPSVWSDVGAVATASPSPEVVEAGDPGFPFYIANAGSITCNRSVTGLTGSTAYKFRLVAKNTSGVTRDIFPTGTATATS